MKYHSLPADRLAEHLDDLINRVHADLSGFAVITGEGAALDTGDLDAAIADIRAALDDRLAGNTHDLDDDQFEGMMAIRLHDALATYPIETLDDPAFWAYLAAGPLWFFVRWREDPTKRKRDGYQDYLDGRVNHACVPLRMFLRAQAVADPAGSSLAAAVPRGTDFWRSHVIRVKTGGKPGLARAVAEQQRDARMSVDPLREYAKRINRRWSNQVIYVLDEDECRSIADSERA